MIKTVHTTRKARDAVAKYLYLCTSRLINPEFPDVENQIRVYYDALRNHWYARINHFTGSNLAPERAIAELFYVIATHESEW